MLLFLVFSILMVISIHKLMLVKILGIGLLLGLCLSAYLITRRRRDQLILIPLGITALSVYVILHTTNEPIYVNILDKFLWMAFCGYLLIIIFRHIFNSKTINAQEIYGTISAYILIGFLFSQIFNLLLVIDPASLSYNPENFGGGLQGGDVLYFSFVTLATVGYGDLTPATPVARAVCVIESITGIMYVAIFIARFVSIHSSRSKKIE
jgi:voltage-gated potassium channel Kch